MAYEEYDYYNEPAGEGKSLKESLREILNGLQDRTKLREAGTSLKEALQLTPNVTESLARGGIGQAIGTSGDLRELRNTINSYLPKSVRNMTLAAEFLANPYATAIQQTAPTTEDVLETVPRITDKYEGYKQHETLGEYIAPSLGYFGAKALKAGKDLPGGLSIMGPNSALWKPEMEFQAKLMQAKGKYTPEEIQQATGLVKGLDGQWRSELSDFWSQMKGDGTFGDIHGKVSADKEALIKDVFEHPELLEAYPHLGEIKVKTLPKDSPIKGAFNERKNEIHIREDLTPEQAKSTILHELTHGVQGIEGMNRGANYGVLVKHFQKEKEGLFNQITDLNKQMEEAYKADDMDKYRQLIQSRDVLSRRYTQFDPEELGYDAYKHYAGEAEARLVQERAGMTPDQLRQTYPYQYGKGGLDINPDEAIITTKHPGTINTPEQSIEPPTSQKDELGFHSPLENAVLKIGQPKGTGEQFLKQLEKTPGVKTEELEVTGLKKYLQDNKFVTKQEVQDFIEKNRLKLENKVLNETIAPDEADYALQGGDVYHDDEYIRGLADDFHYDLKNDPDLFQAEKDALIERYPDLYEGHETNPYMEARLNQDVEDALWEQAKSQAETMYYEDPIRHYYDEHGYDIYGNDNSGYSIKDPHGRFVTDLGDFYDISDVESALRMHHLDEGNLDVAETGAKYADYVLPGSHENYREVLTTLPTNSYGLSREFDELSKFKREKPSEWTNHLQRELDLIEQKLNSRYESGHFDEPNILAHMRVNDRTINGKKTLMVEEIQSDWHQEGRKKGYKTPSNRTVKDIDKEMDEVVNELRSKPDVSYAPTKEQWDRYPDLIARHDALNAERETLQRYGQKGVPDAPYKKTWHELMVKQALDMAAKGDYDAIAFTTGKQQAERYNLAKHVDSLNLIPATSDKDYILQGWKDGNSIIRKEVNKDELGDYVGKEVAEKLLASDLGHGVKELKGDDLAVGGQGMKGFYDKIIPDYINKYTKKWGMGMKKGNLKGKPGASQEEVNAALKEFGVTKEEFDKLPIDKRVEILNAAQPKGEEVHFVELSDAAKKDIKEKGQPMFAGIGALGGVDYLAGSDEQNKLGIFKDLQKAKK